MGKKAGWAALLAAAVLWCFTVGCSGNTVYDSDRQLQEQNSEAAAAVQANDPAVDDGLAAAAGALASPSTVDPVQAVAKIAAAQAARQIQKQAVADVKANSDQELKNWGAPKTSQPYTPTNSSNSRGTSDQQHSNPWYTQAWTWLVAAAGTALAIYTGGTSVPILGPLLAKKSVQAGVAVAQSLVNIKTKADQNPDDLIHLSDIEAELAALFQNPATAPLQGQLQNLLHVSTMLPQTPPPDPAPPAAPTAIATATATAAPAPAAAPAAPAA